MSLNERFLKSFACLLELIAQNISFPYNTFKFLFVDFETLRSLKVHDSLPKVSILLFKFADSNFEVLNSWDIDFVRAFGIVWGLRVSEEGLFVPDVVKACFDVSGFGGAIGVRSSKLLKNLILAQVTHL